MGVTSFIAGTLFGAVVLSTIPTTGKVISQISPYLKQGIDFMYPLMIKGIESLLEIMK